MTAAKTVLITGAAKRLGAACARLLHAQGCNIIIHCHHSQRDAQQLVLELNTLRPHSSALLSADLLQLAELEQLAQQARELWGGLDILVNNASVFYPQPFAEVSEQSWDELLGCNLKAPFFLTRALSADLSVNAGCVVNIIDIHSEKGLPGYPVYSIAKAGLEGMTRILAKELAPAIRVNGVSPGAIIWPGEMPSATQQELLQRIALQRTGAADDIAKAVRFLCFDADYITGQIIKVDGGRTLFY